MRTHEALKASGFAQCSCGTYDDLNDRGQCTECEDRDEALANEFDYVLRSLDMFSKKRDTEARERFVATYIEAHPNMHPTIRSLLEDETVRCVDCGELLQIGDSFHDHRCDVCVGLASEPLDADLHLEKLNAELGTEFDVVPSSGLDPAQYENRDIPYYDQ